MLWDYLASKSDARGGEARKFLWNQIGAQLAAQIATALI